MDEEEVNVTPLTKVPWYQRFWGQVLHTGDISGKVLTLIALPSAIAAVIAYYDEFYDVLTEPDVVAKIESVGIRCALAINEDPNTPGLRDLLNSQCGKAAISTWVGLELHNEDSIDRTIVAIGARVIFPADIEISNRKIELTQARIVEDVLQNDFKVHQLIPWRALQLGPGQEVPIEIDLRPFASAQQVPFNEFRALITADPSPLPGSDVDLEVRARFSGSEGWQTIGRCKLNYKPDLVAKKAQSDFIRGYTSSCH